MTPNGSPLKGGQSYWAFFTTPATVALPSGGPLPFSERLPQGQFVMIGNPAGAAESVSGADAVFSFDPTASRYSSTTTLGPGQGAWAFSANGGTLSIGGNAAAAPSAPPPGVAPPPPPAAPVAAPTQPPTVTVSCAPAQVTLPETATCSASAQSPGCVAQPQVTTRGPGVFSLGSGPISVATPGTFTVTATAVDCHGLMSSSATQVTVLAAPAPPPTQTCPDGSVILSTQPCPQPAPLIAPSPLPPSLPSAPSDLQATALDSSDIQLTWTNNATNADGISIYDATQNQQIATADGSATSLVLAVPPNGHYCAYIYAYNSAGYSDPSNTACTDTQPS